jgi:hypothetical protein
MIPEAATKEMEIPAIHIFRRLGSLKYVRISISIRYLLLRAMVARRPVTLHRACAAYG